MSKNQQNAQEVSNSQREKELKKSLDDIYQNQICSKNGYRSFILSFIDDETVTSLNDQILNNISKYLECLNLFCANLKELIEIIYSKTSDNEKNTFDENENEILYKKLLENEKKSYFNPLYEKLNKYIKPQEEQNKKGFTISFLNKETKQISKTFVHNEKKENEDFAIHPGFRKLPTIPRNDKSLYLEILDAEELNILQSNIALEEQVYYNSKKCEENINTVLQLRSTIKSGNIHSK